MDQLSSRADPAATLGTVAGDRTMPAWFWPHLKGGPWEGARTLAGAPYVIHKGIPRCRSPLSPNQAQTEEVFGFKWDKRDTFDSKASLTRSREWLRERYGEIAEWLPEHGDRPLLLDAGCGAGLAAIELLGPFLDRIRYLGIDISEAVDVAAQRFAERGFTDAAFMQADIGNLPFENETFDVILSEGVLHHTDSTRDALTALARLLKPGGRIMFYVYKKKGPLREYADDLVRAKLSEMAPSEAWKALEPLTRLGIALGELGAEIDIPEPIDLLGIPAGRVDVQRLFYWHVAKMFYHPSHSLDEMNHINFDWYAPANAHRHTAGEVQSWCGELGLKVERLIEEDAGMTVIGRKRL